MKKRRFTLRMNDSEAAVVAPLEFWSQLEEHFEESAKEFPEYQKEWLDARDHVRAWVERTKDRKGDAKEL